MSIPVYMDESGYTGEDLLNTEQLVFVLCSTISGEAESKAMLDECFGEDRPQELKHVKVAGRPKGRDEIVELVKKARNIKDRFAIMSVHKEFALVANFIAFWPQRAMRTKDVDICDGAGDLLLGNYLYSGLQQEVGRQTFLRLLRLFQSMVRDRNPEERRRFVYYLTKISRSCSKHLREVLELLIQCDGSLGPDHLRKLPPHALDWAPSVAFSLVSHWREKTNQLLAIRHHKSSAMAREKWVWDKLVSSSVPEIEVGYVGRTIRFPLNVGSTEFVDPKTYPQVQIADLLAGATAAVCRDDLLAQPELDYAAKLRAAGIFDLEVGRIWPTTDPQSLGVPVGEKVADPIAFMKNILRQPITGQA